MSLYTMKLSDSVDTMEFNLLEVPIQDKDIEGAVDNVVLSGDIYTDFLWLKKRFTHKWSILCKDDYERLRGFYTRQFSNAEVPIYQLLDAPSPIEESAGSGEYIQITTTDSTAKLASVEMLGKAEQTTYSGTNLMPLEPYRFGYYYGTAVGTQVEYDITSAASQVSFTPRADGTSTMAVSASWRGTYFMSQALTAGTYYLNLNGATTTGNLGASVYAMDSDHKITRQILNTTATPITNQLQMAITLAEGETYISVGIGVRTTSGTITLGTLMLSAGSTATAYEPYVGGTPAPNPEFPQPISVVTGENVVKIEGKNLLQIPDSTNTSAGVTFTASNGTLTASGTTTRGSYAENDSIIPTLTTYGNYPNYANITEANSIELPAGTYTASVEITKTGETSAGMAFCTGATMGARVTGVTKLEVLVNDATGTYTKTATFTIAEGERLYVSTYYEGNSTKKNVGFAISNIQLELGSTATTYEPYQGQEFEVNLGKNLFEVSSPTKSVTRAGMTITIADDGLITLNGTATADIYPDFVWGINNNTIDHATCYTYYSGSPQLTASAKIVGGSFTNTTQGMRFVFGDNSATTITVPLGASPYSATINSADGLNRVWMYIPNGAVYNNFKFYLQLEKGATASSFAQYFTPIELCKIGNYQDRIYKENGKWYIEKQIAKELIDNLGGAVLEVNGIRFQGVEHPTPYQPYPDIYCEFFKKASNYNEAVNAQYLYPNRLALNANGVVICNIGDATTVQDYRDFFGSNQVYVYYPLATPTTTEITNEALIAQLDALGASSLYVGLNNIGTETQNAMPTLALTYFPYYPHEIISPKAVRMELTDGGIINACECRENVQITLRETIQ